MNSSPELHGAPVYAAEFATTHWSIVLASAGLSPRAQAALEQLCRTYWYPLYAFVRREGLGPEDAQDLTQSFFARLLERRDFENVRREKGRLRSFLLVSLKHFLVNEWHRSRTEKRGGRHAFIPLDEILAEQRYGLEPADALTAEKIYERRWALALLEQVLQRLSVEYAEAGNGRLFDRLKELLSDEPGQPSQAAVAAEFGMSENAVKQAFHRLRQRYRQKLREEIAHTVAVPGDVDEELRHLIAVLRS